MVSFFVLFIYIFRMFFQREKSQSHISYFFHLFNHSNRKFSHCGFFHREEIPSVSFLFSLLMNFFKTEMCGGRIFHAPWSPSRGTVILFHNVEHCGISFALGINSINYGNSGIGCNRNRWEFLGVPSDSGIAISNIILS